MRPNKKWLPFVFVALFLVTACGRNQESAKHPGEAEFREANRSIIRYKDKASHGNTQQAEDLAATFGAAVSRLRDATIEKGDKDGFSLSHGRMLVYCQLNETHCAFLVHVPELRKFSREAKDLMAEVCWASAQATLRSKTITREHVAVGVKGAMLYDAVMIGSTVDGRDDSRAGLVDRSDSMSKLYPFFANPSAGEAAEPGATDNPGDAQ